MKTLVIATRNKHKVEEIQSILGNEAIRFLTLNDFPGAPAVVEDGTTFEENATKKSVGLALFILQQQAAAARSFEGELYVLADDSGLEVDALNGAPGIHSARFAALDTGAEGNSPDHENNAKLLLLLQDTPAEQRRARFRCVLALTPVLQGGTAQILTEKTRTCSGTCEGRIIDTPRGTAGFGYDPLFIPDGYAASFAELGEETKNRLSHRAKALQELKHLLA